jgi:peptidoglycan/LPS O-acetylase OafA/YrhL
LQAGHAIAALIVVAFHANVFILPDRLYHGGAASRAFNMGYAGVEFFFVLSGFIMFYVHAKDFSLPHWAPDFLRKCIGRINPT